MLQEVEERDRIRKLVEANLSSARSAAERFGHAAAIVLNSGGKSASVNDSWAPMSRGQRAVALVSTKGTVQWL